MERGDVSGHKLSGSGCSGNVNMNVPLWTGEDVADWLRSKGHSESHINCLCNEQRIDGKSLLLIAENDLRQPPISFAIQTLGDVKRLYYDIAELQQNYLQKNSSFFSSGAELSHSDDWNYKRKHLRKKRKVNFDSTEESQMSDADEQETKTQWETKRENPMGYAKNLKPELTKALLAMAYVFVVTWITALVMVIVHDRVPDMEKYPPLPDLFLDNMPHIPWAFEMCEVTGTILFTIWVGVLIFHKYRFILIRRFFALSGTVFLLRCVTMLITSLSVPGTHLQCNPRVMPYGDWLSRLYNAYLIWKGAGMSIQGVRTCGDYMFSGHTVALTMLNFFVTEYTTRRLYFIHTFSWLLNMFGIFFILAAHEHYSIDVFIAFYITSRLFLYYHTLANNQALMQRDYKRTKVWFPLFSYFESGVDGIVPNQYEWPITPRRLKFLFNEVYWNLKNNLKEMFPVENVLRVNLFRVRKKD